MRERWIVYVLRCAGGSLYTGITNDLTRRLERHRAGTASAFTRLLFSFLPGVHCMNASSHWFATNWKPPSELVA